MNDKPSKFAGLLRERQEEAAAEPKARRGGKRLNPDYNQVTAYIPTALHDETKINLIRNGNREFSELIAELLADWNQKQRGL